MIRSGLASVAFRSLTAEQIVVLASHAELEGVEWGGDVHVPHGDLEKAFRVGTATREAGLAVASYGSYYKAGLSEPQGLSFQSVLDTTQALGAPIIRVWAGGMSAAEVDEQHRAAVTDDLQRITALAEGAEIDIALEHHKNTLTDQAVSAVELVQAVDAGNLRLYWQPAPEADPATREESLGRFLPYLSYVHVFHSEMTDGKTRRLPLADGKELWREYMDIIYGTGRDHFALIESVRDDSTDQFLSDAETLRDLLAS
ncbi:MAG: TIM barrel protein [Phycisphaerae bacterium]|nr:TIM barrel protein [Phycisphaerae bacterium]